jgi:riboflavin kinase / FMN adenylyltransferase
MQVHRNLESLPAFSNPVITIGTFDGIHFGHRFILQQLLQQALLIGGESLLITFEPHPRLILNPQDTSLRILSTLDEKIKTLEYIGIDHLVIIPFTIAFSQQSASDYIEKFLIKYFKPHTIIIGHDHHFGNERSGNFDLLEINKAKFNYQLIEISKQLLHEITVSSSEIRRNLARGDVKTANTLLVNNYTLAGTVVHGFARGRTIGYPTANIAIDNELKLIPANGVYAVKVYVNKQTYNGMLNIGVRPTVSNDNKISLEVNLFDFEKDIYAQHVQLQIVARLRDEIKFNNVEELLKQLALDKINAITTLAY